MCDTIDGSIQLNTSTFKLMNYFAANFFFSSIFPYFYIDLWFIERSWILWIVVIVRFTLPVTGMMSILFIIFTFFAIEREYL